MISVTLTEQADFDAWKTAARKLLLHDIQPERVNWMPPGGMQSLFETTSQSIEDLQGSASEQNYTVSAKFIDVAKRVICHRDPERFARLYRILWRLRADKSLLRQTTDNDIIWMTECDKAIRRDRHKMHAFVRFKKVGEGRHKREQFAAWFEPSHYITRLATPFFMRRFPNMDWIIVTPDCTAIWNGEDLKFGPGGKKTDVPSDDAMEGHWKVYFQSIFNPARLKIGAMMSEMPKKYWHNMPEAAEIPQMIATAQTRERQMRESAAQIPHPLAATLKARNLASRSAPEIKSLADARAAVQTCQLCPLHCHASQAVFGEGPPNADLMVIGEQPGDEEDIAGRPFVGPAGQVLDETLGLAKIERGSIYVTNAVKHFKFKMRGKRRLHDRPSAQEISHCRWWLKTEVKFVKPKVIVALGASAARSVTGQPVKVSDNRGKIINLSDDRKLIVTYHPAYILRARSADLKITASNALHQDLALAQRLTGT